MKKENLLCGIYPTSKLWGVLFVIITAMYVPGYMYQYLLFPFLLIIAMFSQVTTKFLGLFFKSIFLIIVFIFIMQAVLFPGETIIASFLIFDVNLEGLNYSLILTSKIIAISSAIMLFFITTKNRDIICALEKTKVPKKVTYVIMATLQMIDQLKQSSQVISDAQMSRGIEMQGNLFVRMKAFIPIMTPLVLSNVEASEERVLTLESRGFSNKSRKTSVYILEKTTFDKVVGFGFILLIVIYIVGGF